MFCEYSNILGEPRKGVHQKRIPIVDIAFNDFIATLIAGIIFYLLFGAWYWFFFPFILGIILHRLFCVNTTMNKLIFGEITNIKYIY
jgi:polyferredoxin